MLSILQGQFPYISTSSTPFLFTDYYSLMVLLPLLLVCHSSNSSRNQLFHHDANCPLCMMFRYVCSSPLHWNLREESARRAFPRICALICPRHSSAPLHCICTHCHWFSFRATGACYVAKIHSSGSAAWYDASSRGERARMLRGANQSPYPQSCKH